MKVKEITPVFKKWAEIGKEHIFAVPVSSSKHVEVAFNDQAMDVFVLENGRLVDGRGFREPDNMKYRANLAGIFAFLNHIGIDTPKVSAAYTDAITELSKLQ